MENPVLSVIIPVYNEKNTIKKLVSLVERVLVEKEIVIVDDGSSDGTREIIRREFAGHSGMRVIFHERNAGKGRAIRTGIDASRGRFIVIQDADLEYDPFDYLKLLEAVLKDERVNVVYGSRFLAGKKVTSTWHRFVNFFLTWLTNLLFLSRLTDMETCYKLFRASALKKLRLKSDGFEIEVELTAKALKAGERIIEVPVSYKGRSFHEGKKICWRDGVRAVATLLRYRFYS